MSPPLRHHVAIHEAAHTVVGVSVGILSGGVSIRPDAESLGHAMTYHKFGDLDVTALFTMLLAGREAERALCSGYELCDNSKDMEVCRLLAETSAPVRAGRRTVEQVIEDHRVLAAAKVALLRNEIERFAAELLRKGEITYGEIPLSF